jgi:hypothetical protein
MGRLATALLLIQLPQWVVQVAEREPLVGMAPAEEAVLDQMQPRGPAVLVVLAGMVEAIMLTPTGRPVAAAAWVQMGLTLLVQRLVMAASVLIMREWMLPHTLVVAVAQGLVLVLPMVPDRMVAEMVFLTGLAEMRPRTLVVVVVVRGRVLPQRTMVALVVAVLLKFVTLPLTLETVPVEQNQLMVPTLFTRLPGLVHLQL